jgi:hypothetical protein
MKLLQGGQGQIYSLNIYRPSQTLIILLVVLCVLLFSFSYVCSRSKSKLALYLRLRDEDEKETRQIEELLQGFPKNPLEVLDEKWHNLDCVLKKGYYCALPIKDQRGTLIERWALCGGGSHHLTKTEVERELIKCNLNPREFNRWAEQNIHHFLTGGPNNGPRKFNDFIEAYLRSGNPDVVNLIKQWRRECEQVQRDNEAVLYKYVFQTPSPV